LKISYYYADGHILAQKDYEDPANVHKTYWYVHDRLGSVRQVLDYHSLTTVLEIAHSYGYTPFGQLDAGLCYDDAGEPDNPFRFTGQWYDGEIGQYYLRARMYDPELMRFTSRDPVLGQQQEPLALHQYLYTGNDPMNRTDLSGEYYINAAAGLKMATEVYAAGMTVAAYGANIGNLDLVMLGAGIMELAPLGYVLGQGLAGGVCFGEGTEILTPIGEVPIEQIKPGSYVWAIDPESGEQGVFEVIRCYKREADELVIIKIGDETIRTTREHPFFVYRQGWCQAGELTADKKLTNFDGDSVEINSIEIVLGQTIVYNFEVADAHTYYVSDYKLLVHNTCDYGKIIQSGSNKIKPGTAKALGMSKDQLKSAVEALKKFEGLPNDYHGLITDKGAYLSKTKEFIGWLIDYVD
jgi:RHS repeat-associated protein